MTFQTGIMTKSTQHLDELYRLVHDGWVAEGYTEPRPDGRQVRSPEYDRDDNTVVLEARDSVGVLVGTNSVSFDGPAGFPLDRIIPDICRSFRETSRRLAYSWRIATAESFRGCTRPLLDLVCVTAKFLGDNGCDDCLFLFNERHERVYARLLHARTVARNVIPFNDAPTWRAVVMHADRGCLESIDALRLDL